MSLCLGLCDSDSCPRVHLALLPVPPPSPSPVRCHLLLHCHLGTILEVTYLKDHSFKMPTCCLGSEECVLNLWVWGGPDILH